jgi:hypothetical protein
MLASYRHRVWNANLSLGKYQEVFVPVQAQSRQCGYLMGLEQVVLVPSLDEGDPDGVQLVIDLLQTFQDRLAVLVRAFSTIRSFTSFWH